jgi:hypothetical protein
MCRPEAEMRVMSPSMALPSPEVVAARARAALAYANIKLTEKGEPVKVGSINQATMARIVSPTNPRGANSIEELWEIADACGVPRSFMEEGFSASGSNADARLAELEDQMGAVAVLLPLLLEATGYKLPVRGVQALEQVLHRKAQADR